MPGPAPKSPEQRRRRNVVSTAKALHPVVNPVQAPALPNRDHDDPWHPNASAWWSDLWLSPMAAEFDRSDLHGLFMLADLVHLYWTTPADNPAKRRELAAEIRLQRGEYGVTPIARRRLQWSIEKADEATDAGQRRRSGQASRSGGTDDPRLAVLDLDAIE